MNLHSQHLIIILGVNMICKKTLVMKPSNVQALTEGEAYDSFEDLEGKLFVLNNQADVHYFPDPYLDEYFQQ